jgi:FMN phosphatase YigB (HAD superfamily)
VLTTLLFDLDGTLLDLDMDTFLPRYFAALSKKVAHVVQPIGFKDKLLDATYQMIVSVDPAKTNEEVFMEEFFKRVDASPSILLPLFNEFYEEDFPKLAGYGRPRPESRQLVKWAFQLGLDVVIATNPVFPASAIWERLRWAGVNDFNYDLVTTYEVMHFCKPNVMYYAEILDMIGRSPNECMVIGNDPVEDLAASELGIKTFLVNDPCMKGKSTTYEPDYTGELREVLVLLKQLVA